MLTKQIQTKQDLVKYLFEKGILIEQSVLEKVNEGNISKVAQFIENKKGNFIIKSEDIEQAISTNINDTEQPKKSAQDNQIEKNESRDNDKIRQGSRVKILYSYEDVYKKKDMQDFVSIFNKRFEALSKILKNRIDISSPVSINKLLNKQSREEVVLIGMINDMRETKNGHIMLELEDKTGKINVLVNKNREELLQLAKELVLDIVIAVNGTSGDKIVFANNIYIPDVPLNRELRKSPDEAYMIVISDLHIGNKDFMHEEFNKLIKWLKGEMGSQKQRSIAKKVKYIIIPGDVVDGVGIHPGQDKELEIMDIYDQYTKCAELLSQIPENIEIIISPGNHDAMRIADPQPMLSKEYAKPLWDLPNVTMVTSPGIVNIHGSKNFPGFDILIYHGFSVFYYLDNVEKIREEGGIKNPDKILKYLLRMRHLAPTHTSTLYIPDHRYDPLVIENVPDFFITGHTHRAGASNYRNVTLITGSCWNGISEYALKFGSLPEPAKVPIINLQTRNVKMMKFA